MRILLKLKHRLFTPSTQPTLTTRPLPRRAAVAMVGDADVVGQLGGLQQIFDKDAPPRQWQPQQLVEITIVYKALPIDAQ